MDLSCFYIAYQDNFVDICIIESLFSALASISFIWQDQDIGITYH